MSTSQPPTPQSPWLADLHERDRALHEEENARMTDHEVTALRRRNADLAAALAQARAGVEVRDAMLADLTAQLRRSQEHAAEVAPAPVAGPTRGEVWRARLNPRRLTPRRVVRSARRRAGVLRRRFAR